MTSHRIHILFRALGAVLVILAGGWTMDLFSPAPAEACGGFFCSQVPIEQSGETIIFGVDKEEGKVTATIQINYQGEAKDFAWVIPVMSQPVISLAPQAMFQNIRWQTDPQYNLNWDLEDGGCWWDYPMSAGGDAERAFDDGDGVQVLDSQEVGPYETATLKSESAEELHTWLGENGFDQPDSTIPLIQHYLDQGMFFVAMKLKQDATAGDIQPVTLAMDEDAPCVPLVLTQVAATPDMPVLVYVLGTMRSIPTNWFHVTINEKKIDWFNYGSNYESVVTQAIDEAGGHGFVTEYAGTSDFLAGTLWWEGRFNLDKLLGKSSPESFLMELLNQGFPRDSQMQGLIKKHVPKPDAKDLPDQCQSDQEFYTWNFEYCLGFMDEDWTFDPAAFVADIDERIVGAFQEGQAIFDKFPYLTRLYTTVSPDEMTRDPFFAFNPELEDVSNIHTATATGDCVEDGSGTIENVVLTLPSGATVAIEGVIQWGWGGSDGALAGAADEPAASKIELLSESGPGHSISPSHTSTIDGRLDSEDPSIVLADIEAGMYPPKEASLIPGCQGGGSTPPYGLALLSLLALVFIRRR
jgi:MYXO-CTERM domain-containing protein